MNQPPRAPPPPPHPPRQHAFRPAGLTQPSGRAGCGRSTAARWYALRHEQPQERRHPERVVTIDRVDYYDQAEVERFWAACDVPLS
ncbi:hypothetical protein ACN24M_39465 [Streptomyces microflavus]|uniref:hypothetical protein n=1 Tax=Streptomyces microflavus TaxID=1919 RepID=UPI003B2197B7